MSKSLAKESNGRRYVRYIRKDIKVSIIKRNILGFKEIIDCKLIDISSAGVQLSTAVEFSKKSKFTLIIRFQNDKEMLLKAEVVRHQTNDHYLSDHIFPTIKKLSKKKSVKLSRLDLFDANKKIPSKYHKLTSTAVKTLTYIELNKKKQYSLLFNMSNGEEHKIDTQLKNCQHVRNHNYGLKFDKRNDMLSQHIFETETYFQI